MLSTRQLQNLARQIRWTADGYWPRLSGGSGYVEIPDHERWRLLEIRALRAHRALVDHRGPTAQHGADVSREVAEAMRVILARDETELDQLRRRAELICAVDHSADARRAVARRRPAA